MKVDEHFFEQIGEIGFDPAEGIILPDGDYISSEGNHLRTLEKISGLPKEILWERIPKEDSALFWLIDYTGCVITDCNSTVGLAMTAEQKRVYDALVSHGVITDKYYDITNERSGHRQGKPESDSIQTNSEMVY